MNTFQEPDPIEVDEIEIEVHMGTYIFKNVKLLYGVCFPAPGPQPNLIF